MHTGPGRIRRWESQRPHLFFIVTGLICLVGMVYWAWCCKRFVARFDTSQHETPGRIGVPVPRDSTSYRPARTGYGTLAHFEDTPSPVKNAIARGKEVWLLESYSSLPDGRTIAELYVICSSDSVSACVLKQSGGLAKEARWSYLNMNGVISGEGSEWFGQRDPDGTIHLTTSSSGYTDLSRWGDGRSRLKGIRGEKWHSTATI